MTVYEILNKIQVELKAPKNQVNAFGKYKYRSCEDILEAVKPLLCGAIVTMDDKIVLVGERYYIKTTMTITHENQNISCSAFARENENQKGMNVSQITGATSSYARKYCANGLFLIDDTKDADTMPPPDSKDKPETFKQPEELKPTPTTPEVVVDEFDGIEVNKITTGKEIIENQIFNAGMNKGYAPEAVRASFRKKFNKDIGIAKIKELKEYLEAFKKVGKKNG